MPMFYPHWQRQLLQLSATTGRLGPSLLCIVFFCSARAFLPFWQKKCPWFYCPHALLLWLALAVSSSRSWRDTSIVIFVSESQNCSDERIIKTFVWICSNCLIFLLLEVSWQWGREVSFAQVLSAFELLITTVPPALVSCELKQAGWVIPFQRMHTEGCIFCR